MFLWLELGLVITTVALALSVPTLGANWLSGTERAFGRFAERRKLAVLTVALAALAARAAVLPVLPAPQPSINDEFSFLLAADTFAHGRLTNPTPPLWVHFETFHVIMRPTYASMYPPAQGLILALGEVTTGRPFAGVCLSVALLCAAICWMLQGWLSPGWALLGGFLAVMHFGVFSYWANSYWGGALAGVGGALLLGALPRVRRQARVCDVCWMGLGAAILANSRPYEGLIFSLPVGFALLAWLLHGTRPPLRVLFRRVVLPLALVVGLAAAATGYYFWRVTGSPLRMPYHVDRATYAVAPYFLWQSPRPEPVYHHASMRDFYNHNELDFYKQTRSVTGMIAVIAAKFADLWMFYFGPLLTLPFVMVIATLPMGFSWRKISHDTKFLLVAVVVSFAGLAVEVFFFPHYAAPMTSLLLACVLLAMRHLRKWQWHGRPSGQFLVRAIPLSCLLLLALRGAAGSLHLPLTPSWPPTWYNSMPVRTGRALIEAKLESQPGEQLALVRYAPHPKSKYEWVYNRADIDTSKVVWARDMGPAQNQELIDYFKGRRVWLVEPDEDPPRLSLYSPPFSGSAVQDTATAPAGPRQVQPAKHAGP
ncbi:MAG TPA: hypothetical protein VMT20_19950 [Terriglobia bacterium]|nr:hypothetical protein [Terriglobia bacterium]